MTKKLVAFDENTNIIFGGETDLDYKKETIVSINGLEGRFFVTENFDGNILVKRIPNGVDEEEFMIKVMAQIERAYPRNKM